MRPGPLAVGRPGDDHERVSHRLGVRQERITEVAVRLQQAGVIRHRRGHISVLDRAGLEHRACECYAAIKREQVKLLAPTPAAQFLDLSAGRSRMVMPRRPCMKQVVKAEEPDLRERRDEPF